MSKLNKVRVQLLDEETGSVLEEVDVMTSADAVSFADGQTFQQKLDAGLLKGQKGDTGAIGPKGDTGPQEKQDLKVILDLKEKQDLKVRQAMLDLKEKKETRVKDLVSSKHMLLLLQ